MRAMEREMAKMGRGRSAKPRGSKPQESQPRGEHSLPFAVTGQSLDPRIARSRQAVGRALMALLNDGRPYAQIGISEVASRAGVTRKTFYAHFDSIDAVVRSMAFDLCAAVLADIEDASFVLPMADDQLGTAIFSRFYDHLETLAPLTILCPAELFLEPARETVETILFRRILQVNQLGPLNPFDHSFLSHSISASVHGALTAWASRDFEDSPEEVAEFVMTMMAPVGDRLMEAALKNVPVQTKT